MLVHLTLYQSINNISILSVSESHYGIEEFVSDIVHDIETSQYEDLGDVYDTLQRMQSSLKEKHEHNYWRVIQCLVEVAIDKIVLKLIRIDSVSCKCHLGSNMFCPQEYYNYECYQARYSIQGFVWTHLFQNDSTQ